MSIQIDTLKCGLRVVSEHMPGLKSASVGVWVGAGARHEKASQNGIAHFLEHMAFKGTHTRSALDIAEAIENVGGYINAYTSREMTAYYTRVLENDVALATDVIGDIVLNQLFDPSEIEVERGVILQEIGQTLDTPDDIVHDWLQEAIYPDQAMGRSILGPSERVSAFGVDDFRAFVESHYAPQRMVLAAAGAVDHDKLVTQAEQIFGHLGAKETPKPQSARFQSGERREVKALEQAHFTMALEAPNYYDDALYTAQIFANILGGGMSSRLFQEVREKRGLCYSIFASLGAYADTGNFLFYAGTSADKVKDLSLIVLDEIKRMGKDIDVLELERARNQMKAGLLMGLESASSRAERLARLVTIWGHVPTLDEVVAKLDAVDIESLQQFARTLAQESPLGLSIYGPAHDAPSLDDMRAYLAV